MPFARLTIALVALAAALPATAQAGAGLDRLASAAAGRAVVVTCDTPDDAPEAGSTVIGSSAISLNPTACRALGHLIAGDAAWLRGSPDHLDRTSTTGQAIQALVHEAMHLRLASGDEALVECAASQNYWPTVAAARLPARLAKRILAAALHTHRNLKIAAYKETC